MKEEYKLKDLYQQMVAHILAHNPAQTITNKEAQHIALLILEHFLDTSWKDILLGKTLVIHQDTNEQLKEAVRRVIREEPIQYILEESYFYGRKFKVTPSVLIPRRETEELVHVIIKENTKLAPVILDIGTGSGCIAVTLKKELPESEVYAWDISAEAIAIAAYNAQQHQVEIHTKETDIFEEAVNDEKLSFDIVVSNPPYVRESEATRMQNNVLKYEPAEAIFVPDKNPLIFYEQIVKLCVKKNRLKKGGCLYLEINENFGEEVAVLLHNYYLQNIKIMQDMQKKDRFIKGTLPI